MAAINSVHKGAILRRTLNLNWTIGFCFAFILPLSESAVAQTCDFSPARSYSGADVSIVGDQIHIVRPSGGSEIQDLKSGQPIASFPDIRSSYLLKVGEEYWVYSTSSISKTSSLRSTRSGANVSIASGTPRGDSHILVTGDLALLRATAAGARLLRLPALTDIFAVEAPLTISYSPKLFRLNRALVYQEPGFDEVGKFASGSGEFKLISMTDKRSILEGDVGKPILNAHIVNDRFASFRVRSNPDEAVLWDVLSNKNVLRLVGQSGFRAVPGGRFLVAYPGYGGHGLVHRVDLASPEKSDPIPGSEGGESSVLNGREDIVVLAMGSRGKETSIVIDLKSMREIAQFHGKLHWAAHSVAAYAVTGDGLILDRTTFKELCRIPGFVGGFGKLSISQDGQWLAAETEKAGNGKPGTMSLLRFIDEATASARNDDFKKKSASLSASQRAEAQNIFAQAFKLFQAGEFDAAVIQFQKGLDIDPANASANFYIAESYAKQRNFALARKHYELARQFGGNAKEAAMAEARLKAM